MTERAAGFDDHSPSLARSFVIFDDQITLLRKVGEALEAVDYARVSPWTTNDWTFLWAYPDPFGNGEHQVTKEKVRSNQLINHYPVNFFSAKSNLVANDLPSIPMAFAMPRQFRDFAAAHRDRPDKLWVRKNCGHRGVMITDPSELRTFLQTAQQEIFVQELVSPPHLIHQRKWDIGVYVLVTSLAPLRIYVYDDWLLRFCTTDFPGDQLVPADVDTYVIADDYLSPWDAPFFARYVQRFQYVKEALTQYLDEHNAQQRFREKFRDGCLRAIHDVVSTYADNMLHATHGWPDGQYQFFELYRFDFIFDDQLNPFLMEANMSPNLSPSAHPGLSEMFSRIANDLISLLGLSQGPEYRLSLLNDPSHREKSELDNRRGWVPIDTAHVSRERSPGSDADSAVRL